MGGAKISTAAGGAIGGITGGLFVNAKIGAASVAAAQAGITTAVGSIFGSAVSAAEILGFSTAAQSVFLGMTSATIAGASLIIVSMGIGACLGGLCYYVYTRLKEKQGTIDQAISQYPVDTDTILNNPQSPDLPKFQRIKMTRNHFNEIKSLTQDSFKKSVSTLICSSSYQVMRQPYRMKCCQKLPDKVGEKIYIQYDLRKRGRCLLCHSKAKQQDMIFDENKYNEILGLRQRLVKVYKEAKEDEKKLWQSLIDSSFGKGYTKQHLEEFQFSN